jgi:hypothetical protein
MRYRCPRCRWRAVTPDPPPDSIACEICATPIPLRQLAKRNGRIAQIAMFFAAPICSVIAIVVGQWSPTAGVIAYFGTALAQTVWCAVLAAPVWTRAFGLIFLIQVIVLFAWPFVAAVFLFFAGISGMH